MKSSGHPSFYLRRVDFSLVPVENGNLDLVLVTQDELLALWIWMGCNGDRVRSRYPQRHCLYHASSLIFDEKLNELKEHSLVRINKSDGQMRIVCM